MPATDPIRTIQLKIFAIEYITADALCIKFFSFFSDINNIHNSSYNQHNKV